jgi:aminoglycoside 3-N-acetyltransferase I
MAVIYQLLGAADRQLYDGMLRLFAEVFEEPGSYLGAVPSGRYVDRLLADPRFIAIVAASGGRVVGALAAYVLDKFEQERKEAYLYDLGVAADHRRRGIATNLIGQMKKVARERGCYVIFVQADQGDTPAVRLYESLGIREEAVHFDIPVSDPP